MTTTIEKAKTIQAVLVDTFYALDINGHGGSRRTIQVVELLEKANIAISNLERKILKTKRDRILTGVGSALNPSTLSFISKHKLKIEKSFKSLAFCGFQRNVYRNELNNHIGSKLLLWETTKNYVAPYVAADAGFKVIALPHNVEALIPRNDCCNSLDTELESLAKADAVFCIAREEEWLFRLKGVNAHFLPYYPPEQILTKLTNVRQARLNVAKARFLILGTAHNVATMAGMVEQLQWLNQIRPTLNFQVDIAGYGTEKLLDYCEHDDFVVHGSVSPEKLDELLIAAKAVLVHQKAGVGALTRIPEMIIAGIPVIASGNACRSAFSYAGVYCYDDWLELANLMSQDLEMPDVLERPVSAEKRFIDCVLKLAQHSALS